MRYALEMTVGRLEMFFSEKLEMRSERLPHVMKRAKASA